MGVARVSRQTLAWLIINVISPFSVHDLEIEALPEREEQDYHVIRITSSIRK